MTEQLFCKKEIYNGQGNSKPKNYNDDCYVINRFSLKLHFDVREFSACDSFALKFWAADLFDKVKYLISVFSFVCLCNYCNRGAMLCSAALLFLAELVNRIQFRCIALID